MRRFQPYITSVFKIHCRTELDESVHLVGDIAELNVWDVKNSIKLRLTKSSLNYSIWESPKLLLPANVPIEYKFFKKSFQGDILWEWNDKEPNRLLKLVSGSNVEVMQTFGINHEEIKILKRFKYTKDEESPVEFEVENLIPEPMVNQ